MKRYYIMPVLGTGTEADSYRTAIQEYPNTPFEGGGMAFDENENSPTFGQLLKPFSIALVASRFHSQFVNDPNMRALPDFPLDGKLTGIADEIRMQMYNDLFALGFRPVSSTVDSYRDAINEIGRQVYPSFDVNDFDINEA